MPQIDLTKWEEEFIERFCEKWNNSNNILTWKAHYPSGVKPSPMDIKSFIADLLQEQAKQIIGEIPDSIITDDGRDITAGHVWKLKHHLSTKFLTPN